MAVMVIGLAGCSADSGRFNDSPLGSRAEYSGSLPVRASPAGQIEQSQLPPPGGGQPISSEVSGGGRRMASYSPATSR